MSTITDYKRHLVNKQYTYTGLSLSPRQCFLGIPITWCWCTVGHHFYPLSAGTDFYHASKVNPQSLKGLNIYNGRKS